jgi:hypothetical protein
VPNWAEQVAMPGDYPMFRALVAKMRTALGGE